MAAAKKAASKKAARKKVGQSKKAASKKAARKKTSQSKQSRQASPASGFSGFGDPKPAGTSQLKPYGGRGSKYKPVLDRMKALKPGQELEVKVARGETVKSLMNKINAARNTQGVQPPQGYRFQQRTTADNNIVIRLVSTKQ